MPTTVTASDQDTLCTLAIANGFLNCQPLRNDPANSAFLNRPLQSGDVVTIPDVRARNENGSTDKVHKFVLKTAPPVSIRFVHGSPDIPYLDDTTTTLLNVSNFVTNLAGSNGQQPFPSEFEFHQPGHDDPDTFKVEVRDPAAGASVSVLLEAMKPIYAQDPVTGALSVTRLEPFQGADLAARSTNLTCAKVRSGVAYRSKYLRLVADEKDGDPHPGDKQAVSAQTLLVTDSADGNGSGQAGDADTMEILDQEVRASYIIQRCPAAAPNQCTVRAQLPIGGDQRRRMPVAFHVFRTSVGGPAVGGATAQGVRFRVFKWLRRLMAQINIGPQLVAPFVEFLDPPPPNMLVISPDNGAMPAGTAVFGAGQFGTGASGIFFTLSPSVGATGTFTDVDVRVNLADLITNGAQTPADIGAAVAAALPAGFSAAVFENGPAFNATNGSCDVLITRGDGTRVAIRNESTDDTNLDFQVHVPRIVGAIHPQAAALGPVLRVREAAPRESILVCTDDERLLIRSAPGRDDVLNFYVVDFLEDAAGNPVARGSTCVRGREVRAGFEARTPIRNCIFLGRSPDPSSASLGLAHPAIDLTDFNYHTIPHEVGHALGDFFHPVLNPPSATRTFHNNTDVMGIAGGRREFNAVDHCKRIPDTPILVQYAAFDPAQATPGDAADRTFNVADRMRTEGQTAGLLKPW